MKRKCREREGGEGSVMRGKESFSHDSEEMWGRNRIRSSIEFHSRQCESRCIVRVEERREEFWRFK